MLAGGCWPNLDGRFGLALELLTQLSGADLTIFSADYLARQTTAMGECATPAWSPDATQLAFICVVDANFEIWYVDVERGADGRLTPSEPKQLITAENIDATSRLV